jgi:hypothetical protein
MYQFFDTLTDDSGNALLGATVAVTNYPSGATASIYATNGTTQPIANATVAADITGQVSFFAPDGAYTLTYAYKGTTYKTRAPVQMADPMGFVAATDSGSANAYVVTSNAYPAQLYTGLKLEFKAANSNTGASTLVLNGSAAIAINQPGGLGIIAGMIQANGLVRVEYDGTQWQIVGSQSQPFYGLSLAEGTAGVTPANYAYPIGTSLRMAPDTSGNTDCTAQIQALLNVAGVAALDGELRVVTIYPGTYKITRLYMNYSNVHLVILPGATLVQTQVGIANRNNTGQVPAYAAIHINPLAYTCNPGSAVTAIQNVQVYGGGAVQGPYTNNPGYQQYALGIVSNDCHKCYVHDIFISGFGGENILLNPSGWNTCYDLRIYNCEVSQGGEVGINNARAFEVMRNYVHDSWVQNGVGGDGDQGIVGFNRIRNMAGGALTPGGSGAKDITASREIIYVGNVCTSTGLSIAGTYAMFASDDGATTVPKYNHRYIGNTFDAHAGPIGIGCDYNTALNICIENNTVTSLTYGGGTGIDFSVVNGSGKYYLRGNNFNPGLTGNAGYGVSISGGTPTVYIEEGNDISGHATADINWSSPIVLIAEFLLSTNLSLTGFTGGPLNVACTIVKHGNYALLNLSSVNGTSNATTMTLGTLPAYLRPTRSQNILTVVTDNGVNSIGIAQVASSGTITFFKDINGSAFTGSGTKGLTGPYNLAWLLN